MLLSKIFSFSPYSNLRKMKFAIDFKWTFRFVVWLLIDWLVYDTETFTNVSSNDLILLRPVSVQ